MRGIVINPISLFVALLGIFIASSPVQSEDSKIEDEVQAAFRSLVAASNELNSDSYFQHIDRDKFIGLNSDGSNWNSIEEFAPVIVKGFDSIEKIDFLEFTNVRISVIDPFTAVLVNEYKQSISLKSGENISLEGGGAQVWSKRSGEWRLVSVSASNKKPPDN